MPYSYVKYHFKLYHLWEGIPRKFGRVPHLLHQTCCPNCNAYYSSMFHSNLVIICLLEGGVRTLMSKMMPKPLLPVPVLDKVEGTWEMGWCMGSPLGLNCNECMTCELSLWRYSFQCLASMVENIDIVRMFLLMAQPL